MPPAKHALVGLTRPRGESPAPAGDPQEVAAAVLFLCSDAARGINGAALVLDGGELRRLQRLIIGGALLLETAQA